MLKPQDLNKMQSFGREAARDGSYEAIDQAAEYMAMATPEERMSLVFWFEEGARNYAYGMSEFLVLMSEFESRSRQAVAKIGV